MRGEIRQIDILDTLRAEHKMTLYYLPTVWNTIGRTLYVIEPGSNSAPYFSKVATCYGKLSGRLCLCYFCCVMRRENIWSDLMVEAEVQKEDSQ